MSRDKSSQHAGTIKRALNVLREAVETKAKCQTRAVALALWVLRGTCDDDWLKLFWEAAGTDHDIGRSQSLRATYNGIELEARQRRG
jgi:hypothetical protein